MIIALITDGFNEVETLKAVEALRKNDIEIKTVSLGDKVMIGEHDISIVCDLTADEVDLDKVYMAILPICERKSSNLISVPLVQNLLGCMTCNNKATSLICTADYALKNIDLIKQSCQKVVTKDDSRSMSFEEFIASYRSDDSDDKDFPFEFFTEEASDAITEESNVEIPTAKNTNVYKPRFVMVKAKPDYSNYSLPTPDLLSSGEDTDMDEETETEIQEKAAKIIDTLADFGITVSISGIDRGPRITRYEVVPAKGVKVAGILNLQDDLALNLAAGSIRIEAPIPGKSAIGIEIPNKTPSTVRLRDLIESDDFRDANSKTAVCIGRDVTGQAVFGDVAKMPHLLIGGAAGMGKTVCINSLIASVLYKAKPDEVKFILIDPRGVEFSVYADIPHLLLPIISDARQAAGALMWALNEMERRYSLLAPLGVRSVDAYNEKVAEDASIGDSLPKIIIVIDEFADLMLQVKNPVENSVMRIAQKARAAGIYLIIGTQRPSVNIITGVIKANVPSRISCKVTSNVDSKTILDSAGAEKLLDKGDILYAPATSPKPFRVQGAYISDDESKKIADYVIEQGGKAEYDSEILEAVENEAKKYPSSNDDEEDDEDNRQGFLFDKQFLDAVEVAVSSKKISTALLQRRLSIGYGKAAKFIDIMEDMGIVGEANGQRPREVLISPDEWREKLARATLD